MSDRPDSLADGPASPERRQLLGAVGAAVLLGGPGWRLRPPAVDRFGVQLYTVRSEMQKSVERTLEKVAELGYQEVEFAGYFNHPPARVAAMLSATNLTSPSAHVDINELRRGADAVFGRAEEIGHHFVTIPSIPAAERTVEGYTRIAGELSRWGEGAARRGMAIAYHNHDFEFKDLDAAPGGARNGMGLLVELSDPALVRFQLDAYWITRAGLDAADWIRRFPGRFVMLHVKDMKADGTMTEVGQGRIDFARIIRAANGSLQHLLVEHDQPRDPFASIAVSAAWMKRL